MLNDVLFLFLEKELATLVEWMCHHLGDPFLTTCFVC